MTKRIRTMKTKILFKNRTLSGFAIVRRSSDWRHYAVKALLK